MKADAFITQTDPKGFEFSIVVQAQDKAESEAMVRGLLALEKQFIYTPGMWTTKLALQVRACRRILEEHLQEMRDR